MRLINRMVKGIAVAQLVAVALGGAALAKDHHKKNAPPMAPVSDPGSPPVKEDPKALHSLTLACSPPGADVLVDGEMVSKAPIELPVPVKAGDHTIKVTKLGYAPFIDVFTTKGKKVVKLEVELVPVSGVLHVTSTIPEARVLVDGRFVGVAPVDVEMDVGARAVQVEKGCYKDYFKNVLAVAGKDENLEVTLESLPDNINPCFVKPLPPPKWYQRKIVWGIGIPAAVVIVAAVVLGVVLGTATHDPCEGTDICYNLSGTGFFLGR